MLSFFIMPTWSAWWPRGLSLSLTKSWTGFVPGFERAACLATLKSSDRTKQCLWMTIYIYIYIYIQIRKNISSSEDDSTELFASVKSFSFSEIKTLNLHQCVLIVK